METDANDQKAIKPLLIPDAPNISTFSQIFLLNVARTTRKSCALAEGPYIITIDCVQAGY